MSGWPSVPMPRSTASRENGMIAGQTTIADWIHLVRSEYLEMPGLHVTGNQVQRLWGLDGITCDALLESLIDCDS